MEINTMNQLSIISHCQLKNFAFIYLNNRAGYGTIKSHCIVIYTSRMKNIIRRYLENIFTCN